MAGLRAASATLFASHPGSAKGLVRNGLVIRTGHDRIMAMHAGQ